MYYDPEPVALDAHSAASDAGVAGWCRFGAGHVGVEWIDADEQGHFPSRLLGAANPVLIRVCGS
jgi:hypothetical protein